MRSTGLVGWKIKEESNVETHVEFTDKGKVLETRRIRVQSRTEPRLLSCFLQVRSSPYWMSNT